MIKGYENLDKPQFLDLLKKLNEARSDVFFVEIGACDGRNGDPIFESVKKFRWRGLLIEPIPDYFKLLQENYSYHKGVRFENVAIDDSPGIRPMYRDGDRSCSALEYNVNFKNGYRQELVKCETLENVLAKHKIEKIDLLQIDAEGRDHRIVNNFDLDKYRPLVINFEANILSDKDDVMPCVRRLEEAGYTVYNHSWVNGLFDMTATLL